MGIALMFIVALRAGFTNWFLVDPLGMHPMVATLSTFMAVQSVAMLLRPVPEGMINGDFMTSLKVKLGFILLAFIFTLILAVVLEYVFCKRPVGLKFRGLVSRTEAARVASIRPVNTRLLAYLACSMLIAVRL